MFYDNKNSIIVGIIAVLALNVFFGCERAEKSGNVSRIRQVTYQESVFQDAMEIMEVKKAIIEKHEAIYINSINTRRDILDDSIIKKSKTEILKESKELLRLANEGLNNESVIQRVSNAEYQYQQYKNFASTMIDKYSN